jgi:hypothetical protein
MERPKLFAIILWYFPFTFWLLYESGINLLGSPFGAYMFFWGMYIKLHLCVASVLCYLGDYLTEPSNFFFSTKVWILGYLLASQMLYHLSHTPSPFCSGYFWGRRSHFVWDSHSLLVYASRQSWNDRHHDHAQLLVELELCELFVWARLELLSSWLISASK